MHATKNRPYISTTATPATEADTTTADTGTAASLPARVLSAGRERLTSVPPWVLLIQLFIGLGWTRAGVEKLISPTWWTGEEVQDFVVEHADQTVAWYLPFIDIAVLPAEALIAFVVMAVQFALGAALLTNKRVSAALAIGMFLNLNFIAAGAVNPSVFYLLAQGSVLLWIAENSRRSITDVLEGTAVGGLILAAISAPWIQTLNPHEVIEDPALMLTTAGLFTALGCFLTRYRRDHAVQPAAS